jgi:hypothetical protein
MTGAGRSIHERAMRKCDVAMGLTLLFGLLFVFRGQSFEMTKQTGPAMYALSALALVVAVILPLVGRVAWNRVPAGDEYLRKLAGLSTGAGFYLALAAFAIWAPLSGTLLPEPRGPQVLGLMLAGAGLCWFVLRWRDAR